MYGGGRRKDIRPRILNDMPADLFREKISQIFGICISSDKMLPAGPNFPEFGRGIIRLMDEFFHS